MIRRRTLNQTEHVPSSTAVSLIHSPLSHRIIVPDHGT
jgi:hypothetical protein